VTYPQKTPKILCPVTSKLSPWSGNLEKLRVAQLVKKSSAFYGTQNFITVFRRILSRRMRWAGHVARMGQRRGVYRDLVGRPEGKKPLGRHRCR
jgi:hypothetical protein